jgi:hypothetical protein
MSLFRDLGKRVESFKKQAEAAADDTYECTECGEEFGASYEECPECSGEVVKVEAE